MRTRYNQMMGGGWNGGSGSWGGGMQQVQQAPRLPPNAKPGDWMCPDCGNHNYAHRDSCNKCRRPRYKNKNPLLPPSASPGDWICNACGNHNFARRDKCNRCQKPRAEAETRVDVKPSSGGGGSGQKIPANARVGDWICVCGNHNYASRETCNKPGCGKKKIQGSAITASSLAEMRQKSMRSVQIPITPMVQQVQQQQWVNQTPMMYQQAYTAPRQLPSNAKPGDWLCPACGNHNYASRDVCNKQGCNQARPTGASAQMGMMNGFGPASRTSWGAQSAAAWMPYNGSSGTSGMW